MAKAPKKRAAKRVIIGTDVPAVVAKTAAEKPKKQCGLCGKKTKLTRTECCGQWICNDEDNYVLFSYARTSCSRNHRRYTLCGFHANEGHGGHWQACAKCHKDIEPEMYAYYGTNEFNFEKLAEVPAFEHKRCIKCKREIKMAEAGYMRSSKGYTCDRCFTL